MTRIAVSHGNVSRRNLLAMGACALVGAVSLPGPASASPSGGKNLTNGEIIRKWYAAWEKKDLGMFDSLLADNFTFTCAAGDYLISRSSLITQCWVTQVDYILIWNASPLARTMLL